MEIRKDNKFYSFVKKFGVYIIAGAVVLIVAITATLVGVLSKKDNSLDVGTQPLEFGLPALNATVLKDYSDTSLQYNETLNKWEAHFSVDITSEDPSVLAVLDGTVSDVSYKYMTGYCVTIEHADGFVSVYSSLAEDVPVKEGDKVTKGQKIGEMSDSAAGESTYGAHLDFSLLQNGEEVDPNDYISLQNK